MKVNKYFRKGVVSVGSAYSYEDRFKSFNSSGLTLYVQDWFGWQPVAEKSSRFPGSSWMEVGNLSPVEKGNILGTGLYHAGSRGEEIQPGHAGAVRRSHRLS